MRFCPMMLSSGLGAMISELNKFVAQMGNDTFFSPGLNVLIDN